MTPQNCPQVACLALVATLVCSDTSAQTIQRVELLAQTAYNALQPSGAQVSKNPFAMTAPQRDAMLARLDPAQRREVSRLAKNIAASQNESSINGQWAGLFESVYSANSGIDVNNLILLVLHDCYQETQSLLAEYSERVNYYQQLKEQLRSQLQEARVSRSGESQNSVQISALEQELASVSDDARIAIIDLQSALQIQQRTLQAMSNVSKMLHDTAMAIIRKKG